MLRPAVEKTEAKQSRCMHRRRDRDIRLWRKKGRNMKREDSACLNVAIPGPERGDTDSYQDTCGDVHITKRKHAV
jgi:hypothetical protein